MSDTVKKSFVAEALVISVSNLLVKIIGVLFKIPMSNMLQEGMGVFNAAYSIYAMLYMVSTAGLPVAISRTVSASAKKGRTRDRKHDVRSHRADLHASDVLRSRCDCDLFKAR